MKVAREKNETKADGKTPLKISESSVCIVSKWEKKEEGGKMVPGSTLTLLSHAELGECCNVNSIRN